jgi:hypothetical protein
MKLKLNDDHPGVHVDYRVRSGLKLGETDAKIIASAKARTIRFLKTEPTDVNDEELERLKPEIRDTVLVEVKDEPAAKPTEKQQKSEKAAK